MIVNARNDTRSHGTNEASFLEIGRILGLDKGTVEHIYFIAMRKIKAKMGSELFYDLLDAYRGGLLGGQNEKDEDILHSYLTDSGYIFNKN